MNDSVSSINKHFASIKDIVRGRPAMYLWGRVFGHVALRDTILGVVSDAQEEFSLGFCSRIIISIDEDYNVSVADNGRAFLRNPDPVTSLSCIRLSDNNHRKGIRHNPHRNRLSASLSRASSTGIAIIIAASEYLLISSQDDGIAYEAEFIKGELVGGIRDAVSESTSGTKIQFRPDFSLFERPNSCFWRMLIQPLRAMAVSSPGLHITLCHSIDDTRIDFHYPNGPVDCLLEIGRYRSVIDPVPVRIQHSAPGISLDMAIYFDSSESNTLYSFVNGWPCPGGTHELGLHDAITAIGNSPLADVLIEHQANIMGDYSAVLVIFLDQPQYRNPIQDEVENLELYDFMKATMEQQLPVIISGRPADKQF